MPTPSPSPVTHHFPPRCPSPTPPRIGFPRSGPGVGGWLALALLLLPAEAAAQISVHPTGVNVNTFAETVVFLTFGGLQDHVPVETLWCGEVEDAFPDVGVRCVSSTVLGALPATFDLATPSGVRGLTDIMTIPASVSRRAYELALQGGRSEFFYVRRFRSLAGGPDVFVPVTCRLAGGGARVPFALLDVRPTFEVETPVLTVEARTTPPPFGADIRYNGSGLLAGRWEVVLPGDEPPSELDLFPEASLPVELRTRQRRYQEVGRFTVFLPPSSGSFTLPGPDPSRLPTEVPGAYQLLLRVEATADKEGDSNLAAVGAGSGVVHTGGVAPFALPPLRYYVANAGPPSGDRGARVVRAMLPEEGAVLEAGSPVILTWSGMSGAAAYRVEVLDPEGERVVRAIVARGTFRYVLPPWALDDPPGGSRRWRVLALGEGGRVLHATPWAAFGVEGSLRP